MMRSNGLDAFIQFRPFLTALTDSVLSVIFYLREFYIFPRIINDARGCIVNRYDGLPQF